MLRGRPTQKCQVIYILVVPLIPFTVISHLGNKMRKLNDHILSQPNWNIEIARLVDQSEKCKKSVFRQNVNIFINLCFWFL